MANNYSAFTAHPWHGIHIGDKAPEVVNAYIEIVPTDTVKYEIDKPSGFLKIDRPQKYSNVLPCLYGFVPKTYCGPGIGNFCSQQTGRAGIVGDGDPLDICVFTERNIPHGNIIVPAKLIGGFRMIDGGQADDKIIAVLPFDEIYSMWEDIQQMPSSLVERLRHYFLTYKALPGAPNKAEITHLYGREEAIRILELARKDYAELIK
ncbi:MAG TPA: inorganic pyrophosphatase [Chitinophagales bacterium]|nr:inorganic pyrophosphatase [Chitinophagales bacterium]